MTFLKSKMPPALSNAPLRRLLTVQVPADFADFLDFVAIGALLAFVWGVEPIVYAFLGLGMAGPYVLIGPFAGVLVDRMPLRRIIILSNLGRGLATAALFFAGTWQMLIVLLFLRGAVDSFFTPAKQAALQAITSEKDRASANGLSQTIAQLSKVLSPGVGGALLLLLTPGELFLANAVLSLVAALAALRLAPIIRETPEAESGDRGFIAEIRAGLRTAWGLKLVRYIIMFEAAVLCAVFLSDNFIPPLLETLDFKAHHLGLLISAAGLGGLAGALIISSRKAIARPFLWVLAGIAPGGVGLFMVGLIEITGAGAWLWLLVVLFFGMGAAGSFGVVPLAILMQNTVPETKMGRVVALKDGVSTSAIMISPFIGAALAQAGSYGAPFLAGGLVIVALAFLALRLDRFQAHQADHP